MLFRSVAFVAHNIRGDGADAAHEILRQVDAVLAMSDELALGVLDVAGSMALRVPNDFSLTGWDDSDAASAAGLTTVSQSLYEQGRAAARFVLGIDSSIDEPTWELEVRASTR